MNRTSARDIADYFVWLAANECENDPDFLTPLKLQKLLYFAQGWALAEWGRPLFAEPIEAWRDGPVVPSIYQRYKSLGRRPILRHPATQPAHLNQTERALVRSVWNAYKRHSGWALRDLTHAEPPYVNTYKPVGPDGRCRRVISRESIRREFAARRQRRMARIKASIPKLRELARRHAATHHSRNSK
jgi:uncharacterized phage-associated protein